MKSKLIVLSALAVAVWACNDSTEEATTDTDTTTTTSTTTPTTSYDVEVPSGVRTSFESRHPNATGVTWRHYKPEDRSTMDRDDWRYNLDTQDYEVSFRWNDMDYYSWYDDSLWVRTSSRMQDHSKLPAPINDVINKKYAGYKITEIEKEHDKDMIMYEVDLEKDNEKWKIHFDEQGKEMKKKKGKT